MKLSHKKKIASKKGTWWPRTLQSRHYHEQLAALRVKNVVQTRAALAFDAEIRRLAWAFASAIRPVARAAKVFLLDQARRVQSVFFRDKNPLLVVKIK